MKAARRQELKTNELALTIEQFRGWLRTYGNYLVIGVVVVAVVVLVWMYQKRSAAAARVAAFKQISTLPFSTDDEARSTVEKLKQLAADAEDDALAIQALRRQAGVAMSRASASQDGTINADFLNMAKTAYQKMLDRAVDRPLDQGAALCGLASVEEDQFVIDGNPDHKAAARKYLERIRDDFRFVGMPFVGVALDRLNKLDDVFVQVAIVAPPVVTPPESPPITLQPGFATPEESTDAPGPSSGVPPAPGSDLPSETADPAPVQEDEPAAEETPGADTPDEPADDEPGDEQGGQPEDADATGESP